MRTLKEILLSPIEGDLDLIDALTLIMITYPDVATSDKITDALAELETLSNAPAPDVNAALVANEECQEILAEVKAQNGVLLDALKEVRLDLENRTKGDFDALSPRVQVLLVDAIANAETSQQPAPALTPREEMERETA